MSHLEIQTFLRVRLNVGDTAIAMNENIPNCIKIGDKTFSFSKIFKENENQEAIFSEFENHLQKSIENQTDLMIFAYGQSGSGKTFSLFGNFENEIENGIILRTLKKLNGVELKISYYEIYNEHIYDLLDKNSRISLNARENPNEGVQIDGLISESISNYNHSLKILLKASQRRKVNATLMNTDSSRSHGILELRLNKSKIIFVDLAGSERIKESGANGIVAKEASFINNSLTTLGKIVNELSKGSKFVPFRNSKLTYCLKNSFELGNLILLATIRSEEEFLNTTLNTLLFAQRVKKLKLRPNLKIETNAKDPLELMFEIKKSIEILEFNPSNDQKVISILKSLNDVAIEKLMKVKEAPLIRSPSDSPKKTKPKELEITKKKRVNKVTLGNDVMKRIFNIECKANAIIKDLENMNGLMKGSLCPPLEHSPKTRNGRAKTLKKYNEPLSLPPPPKNKRIGKDFISAILIQ